MTTDYNKTDEFLQTTKEPTGHNLPSPLSLRPQYSPTYTLPIDFHKHFPDGR